MIQVAPSTAVRFRFSFAIGPNPATGLTPTAKVYKPDGSVYVVTAGISELGQGLYEVAVTGSQFSAYGRYTCVASVPAGTANQLFDTDEVYVSAFVKQIADFSDLIVPANTANGIGAGFVVQVGSFQNDAGEDVPPFLFLPDQVSNGLTQQGYTTTRAVKLDHLDANVSSVGGGGGGGGATIEEIEGALDTRLSLGVPVSEFQPDAYSQLVDGAYNSSATSLSDLGVTADRVGNLDNLDAPVSESGGGVSPEISTAILGTYAAIQEIGSNPVTVVSPITAAGKATLVRNFDWFAVDSNALTFNLGSIDLSGSTAVGLYDRNGALVLAGTRSGQVVTVPVSKLQANTLGVGTHKLRLGAAYSDRKRFLKDVDLVLRD